MKLTAGEAGKRQAMGTENKLDGTQRAGEDGGQWEAERWQGFEEQERQSKAPPSSWEWHMVVATLSVVEEFKMQVLLRKAEKPGRGTC